MAAITFHEATRTFALQTARSTYAFCIHGELEIPVGLHWGASVAEAHELVPLLEERCPAFSPEPAAGTGSLDTLPRELSTHGSGDFRSPALIVRQPDGSRVLDLRYAGHRIFPGKPSLPGLPATYVEDPAEADTLEVGLADGKAGLRVTLRYSVFPEHDAVVRSLSVTNAGADNLELLAAASACVDLPRADGCMLQLSGAWARERAVRISPLRPGVQSVESRRGASSHQHNPFLALLSPDADEEMGEVRGFSLVYSGSFLAQAEVDQFESTRVLLGINPFDFCWRLAPGESFHAPEAVLVFSAEGLGGMSRRYHRLYRTRLCRGRFRDRARPVLLNNWEATYFDFDEPRLARLTDQAAALGIELFVLDDGWFGRRDDDGSSLGDWTVDRRKLPGGLDGLAQAINARGMQFGLWFEPEMVSPDSDLYRAHPEWCLHVPGRRRTTSRRQLVLDFSRAEVVDHIVAAVSVILSSAPISYVKWDMNRSLTEVGSAALPPERQGEVGHRHLLGVYRAMDGLTARFPDVLFEGCSGGGGRFDPGMLYYMPQSWTSDDTDAVARLQIQYGTSLVYPPSAMAAHVSAVPNHGTSRVAPLDTRFHAGLTGAFGYELDLDALSTDERAQIKTQVASYKTLRDLLHAGDFYRLLDPFAGNEAAWMTVRADGGEAFVTYFRVLAAANDSPRRLSLCGLDPRRRYRVNGGEGTLAGDLLMHSGLPVPKLAGDFRSVAWHLTS